MVILLLLQQLMVYKRTTKRPIINNLDRVFWVGIRSFFDWQKWKRWLQIVNADSVPRWHRRIAGWIHGIKSRPKKRKPRTNQEIRDLIRKMYRENVCGAEAIRGELLKLGIRRAKLTIQRILEPIQRSPSPKQKQNWATFIKNHLPYIWSADFFTVPTASFKQIYILVIMHIQTRQILYWNVTEHPSADWSYQQVLQATWDRPAPKYLICDRDNKFGGSFAKNLKDCLNIEILRTPYRTPKANSHCERLNGTLRRECTDHFIFFAENHLRNVLKEYIDYYNNFRPHQGILQHIPAKYDLQKTEPVASCNDGPIRSRPILNGLRHHYYREAA
ncbi:integrase core domain-containing protein [bacterium]|nr:integrase core domain-containing protein [bacterium]